MQCDWCCSVNNKELYELVNKYSFICKRCFKSLPQIIKYYAVSKGFPKKIGIKEKGFFGIDYVLMNIKCRFAELKHINRRKEIWRMVTICNVYNGICNAEYINGEWICQEK